MIICSECGHQIDESIGFCTSCGADTTRAIHFSNLGESVCPKCGISIESGTTVCPGCGANVVFIEITPPLDKKLGFIAMILAFVPGLLDIFGLGHLFLKKWRPGLLFLCYSAVSYGTRYFLDLDSTMLLSIGIANILVFILQIYSMFAILSESLRPGIKI